MLVTGDYLIKYSTTINHPIIILIFTAILWTISIPGWYYSVKEERLAIVGMLFSLFSLIGTTVIGLSIFGERLNIIEWVGFGFAIIAIILLTNKF